MRIDPRAVLCALAIALTSATIACDNGKAEADKKAAEAMKASKEADDKAAAAKKTAEEEAAKAKAGHTEFRAKLQKDVDAHERKATYLKEKASKLTGDAKKNADAAVTELDKRREAAKASLAKLGDDSATTWDAFKKTAEDDVAALGKSIESLETVIEKKK